MKKTERNKFAKKYTREEKAWDEIKEQQSRKEDELLQSKKSPFSGKNYETAHRDVENDNIRWKRLDEKSRKYR